MPVESSFSKETSRSGVIFLPPNQCHDIVPFQTCYDKTAGYNSLMRKATHIQIRLTVAEKSIWTAQAIAEDLSLSEWIREKCNSTAQGCAVEPNIGKCRFGGCAQAGKVPCAVCAAEVWIERTRARLVRQ